MTSDAQQRGQGEQDRHREVDLERAPLADWVGSAIVTIGRYLMRLACLRGLVGSSAGSGSRRGRGETACPACSLARRAQPRHGVLRHAGAQRHTLKIAA